jgi:ADP-ribose pyrophosphatase YjhB (NUDIX family)
MDVNSLRRALEPALRRVFHFYWRFARGTTLGAFGMVINEAGHVFLIRHSYVSGWHLPGGGVEPGETLLTALTRELAEEGAIEVTGKPVLHGVFHNKHVSRRDHVALYIVRDYRQGVPQPNSEIVAHGYFPPDALPADVGRATHARIAEVFGGATISEWW